MATRGTPLEGDRAAFDVVSHPAKHALDIKSSTLLRHLPAPAQAGNYARDDGAHWQAQAGLPLADLNDYARGVIIRGGAVDYEPYSAKTDRHVLIGDGADVVSRALVAADIPAEYVRRDGTLELTADWDAGAHKITAEYLLASCVGGAAVYGVSINSYGLQGYSTNSYGVYGRSAHSIGVYGKSIDSIGVYGESTDSIGVHGESANSYGVYGTSVADRSGYFYRDSAIAAAPNFEIITDHISDTQTVLRVQGDGTGDLVNIFDGATETFTILDGGFVGNNKAIPLGQYHIQASGAAVIGQIIQLAASPSANALEVRAVGTPGAVIANITETGGAYFGDAVGVGTPTPAYDLDIRGDGTGSVVLRVGYDTANSVRFDVLAEATLVAANAYNDATAAFVPLYFRGSPVILCNGFTEALRAHTNSNIGINEPAPAARLEVNGDILVKDKISFTQDDKNEYIDSLNDGYLDYAATTAHRFNSVVRGTSSLWWYCKYIDAFSVSPGLSGATLVPPDRDTLGGYQLNAATEYLYFNGRVCSNWDGATDLIVTVTWEVNVDNSAGNVTDTVDLKLLAYYKGNTDTENKKQEIEIATTVGQAARYKQFTTTFTIDYDLALSIVDVGDTFSFTLNLETDTSEVDDVIINFGTFSYRTAKMDVEV